MQDQNVFYSTCNVVKVNVE